MSSLIQPEALHARLNDRNLVIIDSRFSLQDKAYGRRVHGQGHIPGAVFLDIETELSGPIGAHGGRHPLPTPAALAAVLGRSGIGNHTEVVVYDDAGGMYAGRLWWLLRWLGHDAVSVLDGGFPAWSEAGYPVTAEESQPIQQHFVPRPRPEMVLSMEEVQRRLHRPRIVLLDARTHDRYLGENEPIDPKAGHIPGAINRPFPDNLDQGKFKPAYQLKQELEALHLQKAEEVIVYCGSGVTAAHDLLALEEAGFTNARLYAGSWSDWISYEENEIETGEGANS